MLHNQIYVLASMIYATMARIRKLVDNAYNSDPRVARFKEADRAEKAERKRARAEAARARKEEEERLRKEEEEREKKVGRHLSTICYLELLPSARSRHP